jgi:hypothetical protein
MLPQAHHYETKNEVVHKLEEALAAGKRCLAISDSREHVKVMERYLKCDNSFFFQSDEDGEEGEGIGLEDFRKDPKGFVESHKPQLLFCSPILRSGVSFEGLFDEVFVFVYSANFTSRDIIQFISRERNWKAAHIATNSVKLPIPRAEKDDKYTRALIMLDKDRREQLLVRPYATLHRLAERGCEVESVSSEKVTLSLVDIETPDYAKRGKTGRSKFEEYVFTLVLGRKASPVNNLMKRRAAFIEFEGSNKALINLFATGNYIVFYEFCQTHYKLAAPKWFKKFDDYMKNLGINSNGFFTELSEFGVKPAELKRRPRLRKEVLEGSEPPTEEVYLSIVDSITELRIVLGRLDVLEVSDRECIELIIEEAR